MITVPPHTIVVYSDLSCPWAHLATYRLHSAREELGLEGTVVFEPRPFPLELANREATPFKTLAAEIPILFGIEPRAAWNVWSRSPFEWPVSTLGALEAVQAAALQSARAAETLDRALRRAFFAHSLCITLRHVVIEVAASCDDVDEGRLAASLDEGHAAQLMASHRRAATSGRVDGSPHLFLPDGSDVHNPGISMHWADSASGGFPVVDSDDPSVYRELVERAAA